MKLFLPSTILSVGILAGVVAIPFVPDASDRTRELVFAAEMSTTHPGTVQIFFDDGDGIREELSASASLVGAAGWTSIALRVPARRYVRWRLDPFNGDATVILRSPRLLDQAGHEVRTFALTDFYAEHEIASLSIIGNQLEIVPSAGPSDPQLSIVFSPPLDLRTHVPSRFGSWLWSSLAIGAVTLTVLALVSRIPSSGWRAFVRWNTSHPNETLAAVAAMAVVASAYPVVFAGRSYVSPNFSDGTYLLYPTFPTLPGTQDAVLESAQGSDVGPMAWQNVPYSIVQHRAVFEDHEVPLWNRFNSCGNTHFGQGQTMFGDPLHWMTLAANGAAWAWDLKFILAKWLFAFGVGITVWRATRSLSAALLSTVSSAFIGFFQFRLNHPEIFSVCYSPWILVTWLGVVQASDRRTTARWLVGVMFACWCVLNSGTVKESYMLLVCLTLTGMAVLLLTEISWRIKLQKLCLAMGAGALLILIAAPVWMPFLDAVRSGHSIYHTPVAWQIHPALLLGFFDELFYRPFSVGETVWSSSINFFSGTGLIYLTATWRRVPRDRLILAFLLGALPSLALVFGIIPPQWIVHVPFLANIWHIDTTFSGVLVVHALVLAGFGFRIALDRIAGPDGAGDVVMVSLLLVVLLVLYFATVYTVHTTDANWVLNTLEHPRHLSPFIATSLWALPASAILFLVCLRQVRRDRPVAPWALLGALCIAVMLWRHGAQARLRFDEYCFNPPSRVNFHEHSPAIDHILTHQGDEPSRVVGIDWAFWGGWSGAYGLEGTGGADAITNPAYYELLDGCGVKRPWDWMVAAQKSDLLRLRAVFDLLNVHFYVGTRDILPPDQPLHRVLHADLDVYVSDTTWPRAFFSDRVAHYTTVNELGSLVAHGDGRPFAAMRSEDAKDLAPLPDGLSQRTVVPASNYHLTANSTSFDVAAPAPGIVVLLETWWKRAFVVTVDGKPANVLRVNHAFKGVRLDHAGQYRVVFTYWPRDFTLATVLAGTGIAGTLLGAWLLLRRRETGAS